MALSKQHKIMIVFLSPRNPLWQILNNNSREVTQEHIFGVVDVTRGAYQKWTKGGPITEKTCHWICDNTIKELEKATAKPGAFPSEMANKVRHIVETMRLIFQDEDKPHMYSITQLLGMDIDVGQQLVDDVIYSRFPLFPAIFDEVGSMGRERANSKFREYKGTYHLWMRRNAAWLQCSLRVRYILEIRDGLAIRCKLNVPTIEPDPDAKGYFEYDGFLRERENKLFWMFEKRESTRGDFIYFVTDSRPYLPRKVIDGREVLNRRSGRRSIHRCG